MPRKSTLPQNRLDLIGFLILFAGLAGAVLVYLTAADDASNAVGYEIVAGNAYPINPGDSRRYLHDLEQYGGKAAILADEFNRWFFGLWHGKSLAYTLAFLTMVVSLGCFLLARHLSGFEPHSRPEDSE